MILSASLSGNYDFVIFDSLDGNSALFANVLHDIPVLCTRLIQIFSWNFGNIDIDLSKCLWRPRQKKILRRLKILRLIKYLFQAPSTPGQTLVKMYVWLIYLIDGVFSSVLNLKFNLVQHHSLEKQEKAFFFLQRENMSVWPPYFGCYALRQTDLSFSSQFKLSSMHKAVKTQVVSATKSNTEYQ